MSDDKIPLVVWSGGLDSTYNLVNHISNNQQVDTVYIKLLNNEKKTEKELAAREEIKKLLKLPNSDLAPIRFDYELEVPRFGVELYNEFSSIQAFFWAVNIY
jgi:7-cyano-7-deazaguanine synthase in queuosine biosynthesis